MMNIVGQIVDFVSKDTLSHAQDLAFENRDEFFQDFTGQVSEYRR